MLTQVCGGQDFTALGVDHLTLLVDDRVVLEHMLAHVEVVSLHAHLGRLDRFVQPRVLNRNAFLNTQTTHQPLHPFATETAHKLVLERDVEARGARVALSRATPAQLVVDAACLVPFSAQNVKAAETDDLTLTGSTI